MNAHLALQSASSHISPVGFRLDHPGTFLLGRSSRCDFIVKDDTVSRRHAEMIVAGEKVSVRDLGSRNGTFIDSHRVQQGAVQKGQQVRFGDISFFLMAKFSKNHEEEPKSDAETARGTKAPSSLKRHHAELSKAQRGVLDLVLQGLSEKQVAARRNVSSTTIHNHIQAIYRIFKVHSRSELLALFLAMNEVRLTIHVTRPVDANLAK